MTFYLIGLGLDDESLSQKALEIIKKSDRVYLETYTVAFPYKQEKLQLKIDKKIFPITRTIVEKEDFILDAIKKDVVLLVYGSPLMATTHISMILKCKKENINYRIIHNTSIFDAISETGLQIYKFGKTASMPKWDSNHKPDSFMDLVRFNHAIKAHTLILIDIGLNYPDALKQLEKAGEKKIDLNNLVVCSQLGTKNSKFYYGDVHELFGAEVYEPFCFIIPAELHFLEEEALNLLKS